MEDKFVGKLFFCTNYSLYQVSIPDLTTSPEVKKMCTHTFTSPDGGELHIPVGGIMRWGFFVGITSKGLFKYNTIEGQNKPSDAPPYAIWTRSQMDVWKKRGKNTYDRRNVFAKTRRGWLLLCGEGKSQNKASQFFWSRLVEWDTSFTHRDRNQSPVDQHFDYWRLCRTEVALWRKYVLSGGPCSIRTRMTRCHRICDGLFIV